MNAPLMAAADELRKQIDTLTAQILEDGRMAELRKLLAGLNTLEDLCGQPKTSLAAAFRFGKTADEVVSVQPDEFYGLESLDAAKKYLKKPGKAVPFREILNAIRSGGGDPGNEDKLRMSLARSTWDIAKVGDDLFGLLEFYPHIKRGKKKKNGSSKEGPETVEPTEEEEDLPTQSQTVDSALSGDVDKK